MSFMPISPASSGAASDLGRWLEDRLRPGLRATEIVAFSIPAPLAIPESWLASGPSDHCFAWLPPALEESEASAWVGSGATVVLEASGAGRLAQIRAQAQRAYGSLHLLGGSCRARFFGGMSFAPGEGQHPPWGALGDACFVLPRLAYERRSREARLHVALRADELGCRSDRRHVTDEIADRLGRLSANAAPSPRPTPRVELARDPDRAEFLRRVAEAITDIHRGRLVKLVAAGAAELVIDPAPDIVDVLLRLREEKAATRFAFGRRGACFLGASPELLVRRRGLDIATEAVAGSVSAEAADADRTLLLSPKDRGEHQLVVDALVQMLAPRVEHLDVPPSPRVRRLNQLVHLLTPITGRLRCPEHVLELVDRLHPTPAVGGTPRDRALASIAARERLPRGWYAAPFGWFDGQGDGVFSVALRSALILGSRVHLFAGAGIVSDSNPAQEYEEIGCKLATMKRALGAPG